MKKDDEGDKRLQVTGERSPLGNEELRLWLQRHIEQNPHLTTAVLSRKDYIGMSRPALDQYLAGKYFSPVANGGQGVDPGSSALEPRVQAYRDRVEGTERHALGSGFVKTTTWFQVQKACETARDKNAVVVVYGPPGIGKSRNLLQFLVSNLTTAPIHILCSRNVTAKYFAQRIAQQVGVDERQAIPRLEDQIAEKLKRSPKFLFVDQANYLGEKRLGTVCHLWEVAGFRWSCLEQRIFTICSWRRG